MTKKQAGQTLYVQGFDLKNISGILKVSYNTVAKWSSDEDWKRKKITKQLREQTTQDRIKTIFEYQLRVIEKITRIYDQQIDNTNNVADLKEILIAKGDLDALQKNHTMIKGKELAWDEVVKITRELVEHVEEANLSLAKKLIPIVNDWLNTKRELL